jgi:flagellar motor switch protein FliG
MPVLLVGDDDPPPFDFLRHAEDERLANLLCSERPPTVALVVSHLPPERAGEVMARLTPALQVEVVRRLVDLENTDPESLREIERALEARWSQQFAVERNRDAGPKAVARILAACDPAIRGQILDNLAAHDQRLAEQFGERPMAFEELAQFGDAALLAVYRTAEPEVARLALLGAPPALLERLLRLMPPREAKRLRHKLENPGPICLSDVEEARRRVAALAQQISRTNPKKAAA